MHRVKKAKERHGSSEMPWSRGFKNLLDRRVLMSFKGISAFKFQQIFKTMDDGVIAVSSPGASASSVNKEKENTGEKSMTVQPKRPTAEFLARVGIASVPEGVLISWDDRRDGRRTVARQFEIHAPGKDRPIIVNAYEGPGRSASDIYRDVGDRLAELGATRKETNRGDRPLPPSGPSFTPSPRGEGHRPNCS